jgi:hypothetical protein
MTYRTQLRDAAAAATDEGATSEAEAAAAQAAERTAEEATTPDASEGGPPADPADDTGESTETEKSTVEAPTEYFGLDLSDLEPERRLEIIEGMRKRDDTIGKLLRERASEEAPVVEAAPEETAELSDEDIAKLLGLDTDNPFDETAKITIPLVRQQLAQQKQIEALVESQELGEIDRSWRQGLSAMEREFGSFPTELDHDRVMEFAAENGVASPQDAYWRIMGPGKAALSADLTLARDKSKVLADKKRAAASTRPGSSNADGNAPLEGKTVKEATKEAVRRLLQGVNLDNE